MAINEGVAPLGFFARATTKGNAFTWRHNSHNNNNNNNNNNNRSRDSADLLGMSGMKF